MTFIATVIAKKGAVLIADSLVTTSRPILEYDDFLGYMKAQVEKDKNGEIKLDAEHIIDLFKSKPSYTKDFQEKLFDYGGNTAIMTAGAAKLNGKSLEDIINSAKKALIKRGDNKKIKVRVQELAEYFDNEAKECLGKKNLVYDTTLIITRYSKSTNKTNIYKLHINRATPEELKEGFKCVTFYEQPEFSRVVCAGQNRISERILWGEIDTVLEIIPNIANKIFKDFDIKEESVPVDYINNLVKDKTILPRWFYEDIKMGKLSELSLQQAIDLACLLMRIERDIQKYTENIPTVGGNVKVAVM